MACIFRKGTHVVTFLVFCTRHSYSTRLLVIEFMTLSTGAEKIKVEEYNSLNMLPLNPEMLKKCYFPIFFFRNISNSERW